MKSQNKVKQQRRIKNIPLMNDNAVREVNFHSLPLTNKRGHKTQGRSRNRILNILKLKNVNSINN